MDMIYIDKISVIIAALIFIVIGAFWFSDMMFGKIYLKEIGMTKNEVTSGWKKWLGTIIVAFVFSYTLAFLQGLLGVVSILEGIYVGFAIFIGLILPPFLMQLMWAKKSCPVFFIEVGYWFLSILIMSGFLGA